MSHLYSIGYRIIDTEDNAIRRIIDGGANIGIETYRFLRHHPLATVCSVELADRNFKLLEASFGKINRTHLLQGAIWPYAAKLTIVQDGLSMESFRAVEVDSCEEHAALATWTIPSIMVRLKWEEIDILKLDLEGGEFELFSHETSDWVGKVRCFIFEVPDSDRAGATQKIFQALSPFQFNCFVCGENLVLIRRDVPWRLEKIIGLGV